MRSIWTCAQLNAGNVNLPHCSNNNNDIIGRAVGAAGIPAVKEPSGLDRQDGKRPDGLTLIPWHGGRSLVCDVTVVSPLAASYVDRAATDADTVADMTATRKTEKYSTLSSAYRFEPIAVDNLGVFSSTTLNFISELGRRICVHTGDARETSYLFQRISIMLQCFNSVLLHDTLPVDLPDLRPSDILILAFLVFNPGDLYYLGYYNNNYNSGQHSFSNVFPWLCKEEMRFISTTPW